MASSVPPTGSSSGAESYPKWLSDSKRELTNSKEWQNLRGELQAAIDQQLTESRVDQFTNLSDAERKMFLERALKAVQNGDQCNAFNKKLAQSVNKHVNSHVAQQLHERSGYPTFATKSDLILDQANEASMTLLTRWPELKSKLHRCFNKVLPSGVRHLAWRLFLSNPSVKSKYLTRLEQDPESTMSVLDLDIVRRCETLLQSEPTFKALSFKSDVLHAMKAMLSYHHTCKQTKTPLVDTDYLLAVPVLVNAASLGNDRQKLERRGSRDAPQYGHLITREGLGLLVEQFTTFMATRPTYMKESYNQDFKESMKQCSTKIVGTLEGLERDLANHLTKVLNKEDKRLPLADCLKTVTRPIIRAMFVGYLSLDAVMYVWDQHVIGLDAPEFDIIPAITVLIFILFKKQLLACNSATDVTNVIKTEGPKLKKEQLMHGIQKHFYKELYSVLIKDGGLPVLDPTQMPMPWEDWHREELPPVVRPEDRKILRERRLEEEAREKELQNERERERLEAESARKHRQQEKWQQQLVETERAARSREEELVKLLEEEKKTREEAARRAREEIEKLTQEIAKLKQAQAAKPAAPSPEPDPIPPARVGTALLEGVMKAVNSLSEVNNNEGHESRSS